MKKLMRYTLFFGLSILLISSCKSERSVQVELINEVMEIHDEVMPKMDHILDLQGKVQAMVQELQTDSTNLDKRQLERAEKTLKELDNADASMWDWMNRFKLPGKDDERPHEEIMAYLAEQKESIQEVKDLMLNSIKNGNELLKSNE